MRDIRAKTSVICFSAEFNRTRAFIFMKNLTTTKHGLTTGLNEHLRNVRGEYWLTTALARLFAAKILCLTKFLKSKIYNSCLSKVIVSRVGPFVRRLLATEVGFHLSLRLASLAPCRSHLSYQFLTWKRSFLTRLWDHLTLRMTSFERPLQKCTFHEGLMYGNGSNFLFRRNGSSDPTLRLSKSK